MKFYDHIPAFQLPNPWSLEAHELLDWHEKLWQWEADAVADATVRALGKTLPEAQGMGLSATRLGLKLEHDEGVGCSLVKVDAKGNRRAFASSNDTDYICDMIVEMLKEEVFPSVVCPRTFDLLKQRLGKRVFESQDASAPATATVEAVEQPYLQLEAGQSRLEASLLLAIVALEKVLELAPEGFRVFAVNRERKGGGESLHWVVRPETEPPVESLLWREKALRECTFEGPAHVLAPMKPHLVRLTELILAEEDDATDVLFKACRLTHAGDADVADPLVPSLMGAPAVPTPVPPTPLPMGNPTGRAARGCLKDFLLDQDNAQATALYLDQSLATAVPAARGPRL